MTEVAKKLGRSDRCIIEMCLRGEILGYRDGDSWKFKSEEIDRVASELVDLEEELDSDGSDIMLVPDATLLKRSLSEDSEPVEQSYDTIDEAMDNVDPTTFELLVCYILTREGFKNVRWLGEVGQDKGRDITCEQRSSFVNLESTRKCVVQCKRYSRSVPRRTLEEDLLKATEFAPEVYLLVVSGTLSANTKDWLAKQKHRLGFEVYLWERLDLCTILQQHKDLLSSVLRVRNVGESVVDQLLDRSDIFAQVNQRFLRFVTPEVRSCIQRACENCLRTSSVLTIGHLIEAILRIDTAYLRPAITEVGLSPDNVADQLRDQWIGKQEFFPIKERGIQLTGSVRSALEIAAGGSLRSGRSNVSMQSLIESILAQKGSRSLQFLRKACAIDPIVLSTAVSALWETRLKAFKAELLQTDDDDLDFGIRDNFDLGGVAGINLMSPADSGLSLEDESLDFAGSGISGLDLGDDSCVFFDNRIEDLQLSKVKVALLKANGIDKVEDLLDYLSLGALAGIKGIGPATVRMIEDRFKCWVQNR